MRNLLTLKAFTSLLAAAAVAALTTSASATSVGNGTLSDISIESGAQVARIGISTGPVGTGRPACHNVFYNSYWAFDISTAKGKALLATAQAALLSGKRVGITGATTCTAINGSINVETVTVLTLFAN